MRALIDEAAALVPGRQARASASWSSPGTGALHSVAFGEPEAAWAAAADVAARDPRPLPRRAGAPGAVDHPRASTTTSGPRAKGFYKVEPVVADGGEVVIYAPHIAEISAMHPEINEIGYHCRDYFVKQWDRFRVVPWGVLAHSTHLRGAGTYDETPARSACGSPSPWRPASPRTASARSNLDYLDPAEVDLEAWAADPDTWWCPHAGEDLFRLRAEG